MLSDSEILGRNAEIKKFYVKSNIEMRYAITDVEVQTENTYDFTNEAVFDIVGVVAILVRTISLSFFVKGVSGLFTSKEFLFRHWNMCDCLNIHL